ncbi:MAG: InlB B-repeat-containing protein [Spirochaetes bacterium]|nr:InlB B-repeat-containing protein [Spirochaetota bacterium]
MPKSARITSSSLLVVLLFLVVSFGSTLFLSSCDLFAPSFKVTYDKNGATGGEAPTDTMMYKAGKTFTVMSAGNLALLHHTFSGWTTSASGEGAIYTAGQVVIMAGADISFYAKWTAESAYRVTYNANGATGGSVPVDSSQYYEGDRVTVLGNTGSLTKSNATFEGWNTVPTGSGTAYTAGAAIIMGTSSKTLYAIWTPVTVYTGLGSGASVDVSSFNTTNIYSIVTSMPGASAQGNITPTTTYSYTLSSAAGTASIVSSGIAESRSLSRQVSSVYGKAQINSDKRMRGAEEKVLGSGARQLSGTDGKGLRAAPASIVVGTAWNGVNVYDANDTLKTINTTCKYISTYAYFFVDTRDSTAMETYLQGYGESFDAIYSVNRLKFGNENDVDLNHKVILIFSQELSGSLLGYFYSVDKFPSTAIDCSDSNEGDILYLTAMSAYQGDTLKETLAHEFQHMIYFDQHYNLGVRSTYTWLNEALSQAAEYYNGYLNNHLTWIQAFLNHGWPGLSLTYWTSTNYGYGAIFIRYVIEQYGDTAIKNMCSTDKTGIAAVEAATGASFSTIFGNFLRAIAMSNTGDSNDSKYGFRTLDLRTVQPSDRCGLLPYSLILRAGNSYSDTLYAYEFSFDKWQGTFGTIGVSGTNMSGSAFGLRY